jgi:hypothetical protein
MMFTDTKKGKGHTRVLTERFFVDTMRGMPFTDGQRLEFDVYRHRKMMFADIKEKHRHLRGSTRHLPVSQE